MRSHYQAFMRDYMDRVAQRWMEAALVPATPAQLERQAIYEEMELRRLLFELRCEPWFSVAGGIVTLVAFGWALASQSTGIDVAELGPDLVTRLVHQGIAFAVLGICYLAMNWLNDGLHRR
jgi:hypothetical protein